MEINRLFKTFCVMPWSHTYVRSDGGMQVCCDAQEAISFNGEPATIYKHSAQEVFNSDYMREIRQTMTSGEWSAACSQCQYLESNQLTSHRIQFNNSYLNGFANSECKTIQELISIAQHNRFAIEGVPRSVQIEVGNLCNLKCRMCSPYYSSQIERDSVHSRWSGPLRTNNLLSVNLEGSEPWFDNTELMFENLFKNMDKLELISVIGGEPLLSNSLKKLVIALVENGMSSKITLQITTNGTSLTKDWFDILSQYKSILLTVSIDGVGDSYEYIRTPAKWKSLKNNIKKFLELGNAQVVATPTIQAYNALDLVDIYKTFSSLGLQYDISANILSSPDYLSVKVLPPEARKLAASRLKAYASEDCPTELTKTVLEVFEALDTFGSLIDFDLIRKFMLFTNDLDKGRNQSFRHIYPTLYGMFGNVGFKWTDETRFAKHRK